MKITIYQSKTNPDMGFSIQEDFGNKYDTISKSLKKSKDKTYVVWIDEFEGVKLMRVIGIMLMNFFHLKLL
jgi:hypothetical protein